MMLERLDKIMSGSGQFSRSKARALIQAGAVTVNGVSIRRPEQKVSRDAVILAEGQPVDTALFVYYMMNKPAGYESATRDGAYPAVTRLLSPALRNRGLFPVGRLDADVTGLLLLTDDGGFAHRVTAPRAEVPKTYEIFADGPLTAVDAEALASGVTMRDGTVYKSARLELDASEPAHGFITVTEGKYHEVKNLVASRGRHITSMRRVRIGGLSLDESLAPGQIRPLTAAELNSCLKRE
ncbi:MAG: 16S rRNA pseudouridine(516) synthase [Oscillospiraceae bacterium]|nr:16S rRNA pseudouridine(516) synthase [Oscillospiraceae bacterium]